jgi:hypothetical protein
MQLAGEHVSVRAGWQLAFVCLRPSRGHAGDDRLAEVVRLAREGIASGGR